MRHRDDIDRFAATLAAVPTRRVRTATLISCYAEAFPDRLADGTVHRELAELVAALQDRGDIACSVGVDRSTVPPLPVHITRLDMPAAPAREDPAGWYGVVWHPALRWVGGLPRRPVAAHRAVLLTVNEWLLSGGSDVVVPREERSLELFGDEKAIGGLVDKSIWGPDRLNMDLLACDHAPLPLITAVTGHRSADRVLVVENYSTFRSVRQALEAAVDSRYAAVVWGDGGRYRGSVGWVAEHVRCGAVQDYFGDLDVDGIRFLTGACRRAGPGVVVSAAAALYRALVASGVSRPCVPAAVDGSGLPAGVAEQVVHDLAAGRWRPQEAVGLEVLADISWWAAPGR